MERNKIDRTIFRSSLLKHIIIRSDFTNLTNLAGFVEELKKDVDFAKKFRSSKIVTQNRLDIKAPFSLVEDKYLPVDNYHINSFYRFFNSLIEPIQELTLDITLNTVCIDITCNRHYNCIDEYLDLMCMIVNKMQTFDSFVRFNRFGIRKIDGDDFTSLTEKAYTVFQSHRFAHDDDFESIRRDTSKYKGTEIFKTENDVFCNLERCVEALENNVFRFSLDIDTYIDERTCALDKIFTKEEIFELLSNRLNHTSFLIFREFVTDEFLNKGYDNYIQNI